MRNNSQLRFRVFEEAPSERETAYRLLGLGLMRYALGFQNKAFSAQLRGTASRIFTTVRQAEKVERRRYDAAASC